MKLENIEENVFPQDEIITLRFRITNSEIVEGQKKRAVMLFFEGTTDTKWFQGRTLPGSIDTQIQQDGEPGRLSARYMLEGIDSEGQSCRIFIENNGTDINGDIQTTPMILTDSKVLAWLETAELTGRLDFAGEEMIIRIFSTGRRR